MTFILRDYQTQALEKTYERLAEGHRPIICAPCGSGKTVCAAQMAKDALDAGERVLWMTGREEIIRQAYKTFTEFCGVENVGVLCAGLKNEAPWWFYPKITLASWATLKARWDKSDTWHIPADLVMADEAHISLSPKMMRTVMPHYADKKVVGFTATPSRKSGTGLGSYYTRIIQVRKVSDIIADGYLAQPEYWAGSAADTSKCPIDSGTKDYKTKELGALHQNKKLIGDVVDNWLRIAKDRHTLVFAVDIAHAQALAERFQSVGIEAASIHSKMAHETRTKLTDQFFQQRLQVLVNVQIATYGYDVPSCNCVVVARPTRSIVLWHQMLGRGMRPNENGEETCILDHGDNVRRLGCVEDFIRWRLTTKKRAATNVTREGDVETKTKPETPPTECRNCHHLFSGSRVCPKCGWEVPVVARDIDHVEADLVRIRKARSKNKRELTEEEWYRMMLGWCEEHGKKPGMAYYRFKERFKHDPPRSRSPLEPDARVSNYMRAGLIRYAKRKEKERKRHTNGLADGVSV